MKKWFLTIIGIGILLSMAKSGYSQLATENRIRMGIQYYLSGDLENAYQVFQSMEHSPPLNKKYFLYYALTLKDLHYTNYGEWIEKGLEIFPEDPDLKLAKIEWLADQRKFVEALKVLETLESIMPKKRFQKMASYLSYNQGVVLYQKGKKKESAQWFLRAYQFHPEPMFIRNYAIVLYETDRKKEAKDILEEYVRKYPTDEQMNKLLIQIYNETKEVKKLGKLLEKNARFHGSVEDSLVLAQYYLYTGKFKRAENILQSIERMHPQDKRPFEIQLEFWKKQLQRTKIDSILTAMERKFPGDTAIWNLQLENYMEMDSLEAANRVIEKMLRNDSLRFSLHALMLHNLKKKDVNLWEAYLEKITTYPFPPEDMEKIAHYWFEARQYEKAERIYRDLLMIQYETPQLLTDMGIIYRQNGKADSAKIFFQKAVQAKANRDYRSYFQLADMFLEERDSTSAYLYYEIGMEILLEKLGAVQEQLVGKLRQNQTLLQETQSTRSLADENEKLESYMHQQIIWFSKNFPPEKFENFLNRFLSRFPKNKNLRYVLGKFYLQQKKYTRARSMMEDVLYMAPKHIPARRTLILIAKEVDRNPQKAFSLYLDIFRIRPDSLMERDYREMIRLARQLKLDRDLAQEWLVIFDQGYREPKFVKHLIELLHYSGFHDKAREVQAISGKKKRWVRMNPLLEFISPTNSKRALP